LIVVDMLLTGFDAPIEQVMYLDAPLKEHTLLQAIARVNRTFEGKTHGLIVDYWGITDHLQEALELFNSEDVQNVMLPLSSALQTLELRHRGVLRFFADLEADDLEGQLRRLEDASEREAFSAALRLFSSSMDMVLPDPAALKYLPDLKRLLELRQMTRNRFERSDAFDWSGVAAKVRKLIDESVTASGVRQIVAPVSILAPDFADHIDKLGSFEAKASEMAHAARFEITAHLNEDPVFYGSLRDRLEELIQARLENRLSAAEQFAQLVPIIEELRHGTTSQAHGLGLSETDLAFHGVLERAEVADATDVARRVGGVLRELVVIDWIHKDDIQREMRRALRRELRGSNVDKAALEGLLNDLLEIARARLAQ
jgi:type I restriction enzyme R subunit